MAWTQADLDQIRELRKRGVTRIRHLDGREVQYDLESLADLEKEVAAEVAAASGLRSTYGSFCSG